jgi:hypothetical protein
VWLLNSLLRFNEPNGESQTRATWTTRSGQLGVLGGGIVVKGHTIENLAVGVTVGVTTLATKTTTDKRASNENFGGSH